MELVMDVQGPSEGVVVNSEFTPPPSRSLSLADKHLFFPCFQSAVLSSCQTSDLVSEICVMKDVSFHQRLKDRYAYSYISHSLNSHWWKMKTHTPSCFFFTFLIKPCKYTTDYYNVLPETYSYKYRNSYLISPYPFLHVALDCASTSKAVTVCMQKD